MTRPVRDDQHGTPTGYTYGCRCDECKRANSLAHGRVQQATDCIEVVGDGKGQTSRCLELVAELVRADGELRRVARRANRSEKAFAQYAHELREAKARRNWVRQNRDEHMALCDAAAARFGAA